MIMQPAMVPVILRVFGEGGATTDVPVTPETTCRDVVECTRDPGEDECRLVELWRDCERTLREDDHPLEILQEWGCHRDEVRFVLRYTVVPPASPPQQLRSARGHQPRRGTQALAPRARRHRNGGRNTSNDGGMKEPGPLCDLLPEGAGLTLSELREMAGRQQRQIDSQRQLLAAKEQRLLFLKQQDARSHAAAAEQERLRRLRARVDAQEMKLRKLRALRGQVDQQRVSNTALTSDLDSIRALFNEKEKELCMAVAKVEELTRQLEEVKRGRANAASSANSAGHPAVPSAAALELDKLRRELMYRNKLNEQQCQKLSQQRETINARHEEMARIDARISELQERLHRKRLLNQQLASQLSAQQQQQQQGQGSVPAVNNVQQHRAVSRPNIAAVEPFLRRRNPPPAPAVVADLVVPAPAPEFAASKSDPKYQTLPYNTKFAASLAAGRAANKAANEEAPPPAPLNINNNNNNNVNNNNNLNVNNNAYNNLVNLVHSTPAVTAARKGLATGLPDAPSGASSGVGEPPPSQQQQQQQPSQSQQRLFGSSHPSYIPPPPAPSGPRGQPVGGASCPQRGTVRPPNGQDLAQNVAAMVQSAPVKPPVVSTASQQLTSNGHQRLQASSSLPSTPLSSQPAVSTNFYHPNRPVSSVAPSVSSNDTSPPPPPPPPMQKPSPIYQASATKVMIPHPITLSTPTTTAAAANGSQNSTSQSLVLSPPQSTSTPIAKTENDSASSRPRPALPPKPAPPPRLLQQHAQPPSPEGESSPSSPPPPPATEPPVDEPSPLSTPTGITRKAADLPIKARPLTLKKPVAGEQPKLKAAATSRRIEMPPAFLFPETEPPPADLSPPSSGTPSPKEGQDEPDRAITSTNTDEPVKSEGARVEALNNINQEHLSGEQLVRRAKKGGLKSKGAAKSQAAMRRVSFDPLALLLDASLEGELELVKRTAGQVANPSAANDEGITALHNAICAGHFEIVRFLVQFGCDVNAQDSDGWTPLHCAASCNNLAMVKFLVEHGACIFATTLSDRETAAEKCEEDEEGFDGCSEYLYSVQEKLGILNQGQVYAVYDYEAHNPDELGFSDGEQMVVLRKGDELEREWWWSRLNNKEGYVPRNLLGLYPRVQFKKQE